MKFVSDLLQVGGFLKFTPPIKLTEYLRFIKLKMVTMEEEKRDNQKSQIKDGYNNN
jgi:hypothetical protein